MKLIAAAALAAAMILAGCGGEEQAVIDTSQSSIPKPNASQAQELRSDLAAVHPGLDIEDSVDNARNTCTSILGDVAPDDLIKAVQLRFEGDGIQDMSANQARQVVAIIRQSTWCT